MNIKGSLLLFRDRGLLPWVCIAGVCCMLLLDPSSGLATAVLVVLGIFGLVRWRRTLSVWKNPAGILFILGTILSLLSIGWSYHAPGTLRDLTKSLPLAFCVLGLPSVVKDRTHIWRILLFSACLFSVMFVRDIYRIWHEAGWPELFSQSRYLRPYLYNHPNVSSMLAGMSAFVFACSLFWVRRVWWRIVGSLLGMGIALVYLVVMASRGPQLAFALSCLILPVFLVPRWKPRLAVLVGVLLVGASIWPVLVKVNPRFADASMVTFSQRDTVWRHTCGLIASRPFLGYGHGKKVFVQAVYHNDQKAEPVSDFHYPHAHSYWLMLLFQCGILGVLVWGAAWLALGIRLLVWMGKMGREEVLQAGWHGQLPFRSLPVLLGGLVGFTLIYGIGDFPDNILRMCQFLLVGLILGLTHRAENADEPVPVA